MLLIDISNITTRTNLSTRTRSPKINKRKKKSENVAVCVVFGTVSIHWMQNKWLRSWKKDEYRWFRHRERNNSRSTIDIACIEHLCELKPLCACCGQYATMLQFILRIKYAVSLVVRLLRRWIRVCVRAIEAIATVKTGTDSIQLAEKNWIQRKVCVDAMCWVLRPHTSLLCFDSNLVECQTLSTRLQF